ncbi:MAG: DUF1622 domain-containing protein [Proteobacteria bacterium]|nr:MAG: DUF1622 domain-containing protein [Pseudomonadota bacterium]
MEWYTTETIHSVSKLVEISGLTVLIIGGLYSVGRFFLNLTRGAEAYPALRKDLGRSILLGLEFLVAGDIISTIAIEPTLTSVSVLGLIVIIRTFLSFSLEVEIDGKWPWQRPGSEERRVSVVPEKP